MDLEFSKSTTFSNEMYDRVSKYLKEKSLTNQLQDEHIQTETFEDVLAKCTTAKFTTTSQKFYYTETILYPNNCYPVKTKLDSNITTFFP